MHTNYINGKAKSARSFMPTKMREARMSLQQSTFGQLAESQRSIQHQQERSFNTAKPLLAIDRYCGSCFVLNNNDERHTRI